MKDTDLDRILSQEEEILPSSGFAASVMEAVQREANATPPIPFPWKRALPGLCAAGLMLPLVIVASVLLLVHQPAAPPISAVWYAALASLAEAWKNFGANWIALALILSFASVKISMHLASGRASRSPRM